MYISGLKKKYNWELTIYMCRLSEKWFNYMYNNIVFGVPKTTLLVQ